MSGDTTPKFTFQHLEGRSFQSLTDKSNKEFLLKWSMQGRINIQTYSFDQPFQSYQRDDFVIDFFQDPCVVHSLKVVSTNGTNLVPMGVKASSVIADDVPCSVLSMSYFDKLYDCMVVREGGQVKKCFDEFYGDFVISDELRKLLLLEDSDNYEEYSEAERSEFLFRIFKHLCLGGSVCQYEDTVQPYLDITKSIYKDLVSVQKDQSTGDLLVTSYIYKVTASDDTGVFFPSDKQHEQTFSYVCIDPLKRHVNVFYHNFGASVFA